MAASSPAALQQVASVTPPSQSRAWQTAVHPRLPYLATCNSDKCVTIYSLATFAQVGSGITGGHSRSVRTVAWKPNLSNESVLATGSFDASVGIWRRDDDYRAGERVAGGEVDFTNPVRPSSASFDNDGGGGDDGRGEDDEEEEWRYALVLDGHDSEVKSVAWSAGGNLLATCARDKSVWIWEEVGEDDYETIAVLTEHQGDVKSVAWHPEEELLASGSYDDDVRLWREDVDDWDCVAVLRGHASTVWMVAFEGVRPTLDFVAGEPGAARRAWIGRREAAGPRLVSCSDDRTIRVWRRVPKERAAQKAMSIIRTAAFEEDWVLEATLPPAHELAIYAVAWSRETGRIVSTGSDGKIVVYEERWGEAGTGREAVEEEVNAGDGSAGKEEEKEGGLELDGLTSWHVVAEIDGAHGVHEVNHVAWSRRVDQGKSHAGEEVIISTGDDGGVNIWALNV